MIPPGRKIYLSYPMIQPGRSGGKHVQYGNHLTPGLTEVRSYAAFFTSFLAEGLRVRFRTIPALNTS